MTTTTATAEVRNDVTVETIGPARAHAYLGHNTHNRHPRHRKVDAFARDMQAGRWRWNGAPIVFSTDGVLLDGQNRLMAVVQSDTSQPFLVVRGVEHAAQETMDTGSPRKFSDALQLRGEPNSHALASVVRLAHIWELGGRRFAGAQRVFTIPELTRTLEANPDLRDTIAPANRVRHAVRIPASVGGLCYWLFNRLDAADADHFFTRLASAEDHHSGEPIYALRCAMQRSITSQQKRGMDPTIAAAWTIKAWNKYRAGERVDLLRYKPGGASPERFPEPI